MERNGQNDSLRVIPTLLQDGRGSACILVLCELWAITHTLSRLSHLFKDVATNKFSMEFIIWYLASGSPEAESEMGITVRDLWGGVLSEGGKQNGAGKRLSKDVVSGKGKPQPGPRRECWQDESCPRAHPPRGQQDGLLQQCISEPGEGGMYEFSMLHKKLQI